MNLEGDSLKFDSGVLHVVDRMMPVCIYKFICTQLLTTCCVPDWLLGLRYPLPPERLVPTGK